MRGWIASWFVFAIGGCAGSVSTRDSAVDAVDAVDSATSDALDSGTVTTVPTLEMLERNCITVATCMPQRAPLDRDPAFSVSACIAEGDQFFHDTAPMYGSFPRYDIARWVGCGADAGTCSAYSACLVLGDPACANNARSVCTPRGVQLCSTTNRTIECARLGLQCTESMSAPLAAACTSNVTCAIGQPARCVGDALVTCDFDTRKESVIPCDELAPGTRCQPAQGGNPAACVSRNGAACTTANERCDGDTRVVCRAGVTERYACGLFNQSCAEFTVDTRTLTECRPRAGTCSPDGPDTCDGARLIACVRGVPTPLECPSGTRCQQVAFADDPTQTYAACR